MQKLLSLLAIITLWTAGSTAQQAAAPQTARQALLEMFFSKTQGTFVKHLPLATRTALENSGAMPGLQQYSLLASQLQSQGQSFQTFETGSVLLSGENPKTGQKVDITVEKDAQRGNEDDIELSFQTYKDGKQERTPFMPRMTFSMKQEKQVWKLNEISVTIRLPLADPDLLKALTERVKPQTSTASTFSSQPQTTFSSQSQITAAPTVSDATIMAAMKTIITAETTYAATYPRVGYTCT